MITQAGQVIVQFADNFMVAQLGTAEFAGVSFANSIFMIGLVFCTCFTQGLVPFIGQNFGQGKHKEVAKYFQNSFILDALLSVIILAVMFSVIPFMTLMGQDPSTVGHAQSYYAIVTASLLPYILFFAIRNFSEGIGITKYAMYITIASNLVNILLNYILIFGNFGAPKMGVDGAAIATLVSRILMFIGFAVLLFKVDAYKEYMKMIKKRYVSIAKIKELLNTSLPVGLQGLTEVTAFSVSSIMVGWFSKEAMAANQIALTFTSFSFMIAQGIGAAATIRVSHQFGEKRFYDTRKAGFAAAHLSVMLMSISGITYTILRGEIPKVFSSDPQVIQITSSVLIIAAAFQIFDAIQLAGIASLRALKDVKAPLFYSIGSYYFVCLPLGYVFGHLLNLGPNGVWIGLMLGLLFAAVLFMLRFHKLTNQYLSGVK